MRVATNTGVYDTGAGASVARRDQTHKFNSTAQVFLELQQI
jgi:hypothetical protein